MPTPNHMLTVSEATAGVSMPQPHAPAGNAATASARFRPMQRSPHLFEAASPRAAACSRPGAAFMGGPKTAPLNRLNNGLISLSFFSHGVNRRQGRKDLLPFHCNIAAGEESMSTRISSCRRWPVFTTKATKIFMQLATVVIAAAAVVADEVCEVV